MTCDVDVDVGVVLLWWCGGVHMEIMKSAELIPMAETGERNDADRRPIKDDEEGKLLHRHLSSTILIHNIIRTMMRSLLLTFPILITCLASAALTQASPFTKPEPPLQAPMIHQAPGIVLPGSPSSNGNDNDDGASPVGIIISDVLGRDRSISIFASLSRDVDSVAARLQNGRLNATVLAPLNAEIAKLPRKPWEGMIHQMLGFGVLGR